MVKCAADNVPTRPLLLTGALGIYSNKAFKCYTEATLSQLLCHSPCKPGVAGLIVGFSSLLDETINRGPLAFAGTMNPNPPTNHQMLHNNLRSKIFYRCVGCALCCMLLFVQ